MATKRIVTDKDFGTITIRTHRLARNITLRTKPDGLHVTVPPYTLTRKVQEAVELFRVRLLESWQRVLPPPVDDTFRIEAPCFRLRVERGGGTCFSVRVEEEKVRILCPHDADFTRDDVQRLLRAAILRAMKRVARSYLPALLGTLAAPYGLVYRKVKITASRGRWGSCSATGNINLSCYLMLLPPHLMDYVLLHELAHTREMNHGPRFWELLDSLTGGQAKALRTELRNTSVSF